MNDIIVPVNDALRDALISTESILRQADDKRRNDRDSYGPMALALNHLAVALLQGLAPDSLMAPRMDCARVNLGPKTPLMAEVSESATYLRERAAVLLRGPSLLSMYNHENYNVALGKLKALFNLALVGIRKQAEIDLQELSGRDASQLLSAADGVASSLYGKKVGQHK